MKQILPGREVIFEFTTIGALTRVAAIDVTTGVEASLSGPASTSRTKFEELALQKLRYVLKKRNML